MTKKNYQDKYLEEKFEHLNEKINMNYKNQEKFLNQILEQTKKTNGRVTKLENETNTLRFLSKNPKLIVVFFAVTIGFFVSGARDKVFAVVGKVFGL